MALNLCAALGCILRLQHFAGRSNLLDRSRGNKAGRVCIGLHWHKRLAVVFVVKLWRVQFNLLFRGQELPFSSANALLVYNALPWIKRQVDEGIGDLANFLKA